ncbi:folate-binding protein YgfZ [Leptolyngbya sp. 'hensonii']|uniref:CAF17-like 4Fe-4S cluster assembly/insertion protein YgfZ n=1 Tax=Leptolyngbya sp. 'hensonii' TaxID=1922337 RepID=UPI0009502246|nr:folate-binding protein YgfZ [Leptolyngbya sp. 'hensonii']OLP19250.1 folate-binding protein YgfZ [Leptolyngbya sp. 'hensonii']
MMQDLRGVQVAAGAVLGPASQPLSFGNDAIALDSARTGVSLYDRSHWGLIQVGGDDRIRYLHNQSTNDFYQLQPGQGCETVFVTSTARTIDLATAYVLADGVLLLVSPGQNGKLMAWLDRYIFGADRVTLTDLTGTMAIFNLIGPASQDLLTKLGIAVLGGQPEASHREMTIAGVPVRLASGTGLAIAGYTLMTAAADGAILWQALQAAGAVPMGEQVWEQLRIEQGRPLPGRELTEDYNPLEAGLWPTISFTKGCYIGQETIARLNTYQGVKQRLWGVRLSSFAESGAVLMVEEDKVGKLTSVIQTETGPLGLAYVRTKAGGSGLQVRVLSPQADAEPIQGELVAVPFLTHPLEQDEKG